MCLCSCTASYVRVCLLLVGVCMCVCLCVYAFPNSTIMSSYPSLLLPPPVLLLFLSFPLLLLFPETSFCTAVARKEPKFRRSGHSDVPNEVNCTVSCADAFPNNGTKPANSFSDSSSSNAMSPSSSRVTDGLNVSEPNDQTSLKSGTILSQSKATSPPNNHTVFNRPLNDTELLNETLNQPLNPSTEEKQLNVALQHNDPPKEPITSMPSSKPATKLVSHITQTSQSTVKNLPYQASTSPSPIPRSSLPADSLRLSNGHDSTGDSIPYYTSNKSSNTTATVTSRPAIPVAPTNTAESLSQPGSTKPDVSATAPSTNPTALTLSQTTSPLTAAPPRTTTTTTPSTTTTTMISTSEKNPQSPSSALEPKTSVTTGAPVELSTSTTTFTATTAAAARSVNSPISTAVVSHLADTASLLAVLLFGLLFFLVTVALFVMQAFESYRRKDYTQVDYLINGMYTDSGV
ncbi:unnamed protein product [Lota lota]